MSEPEAGSGGLVPRLELQEEVHTLFDPREERVEFKARLGPRATPGIRTAAPPRESFALSNGAGSSFCRGRLRRDGESTRARMSDDGGIQGGHWSGSLRESHPLRLATHMRLASGSQVVNGALSQNVGDNSLGPLHVLNVLVSEFGGQESLLDANAITVENGRCHQNHE